MGSDLTLNLPLCYFGPCSSLQRKVALRTSPVRDSGQSREGSDSEGSAILAVQRRFQSQFRYCSMV